MALTKVAGDILDPGLSIAGVVTATAFDGPFRGGSGSDIIAGVGTFTELDVNGNADFSGNVTIGGSFTVQGDYTTLNTTLRNVELLRVAANSATTAGIITQTGAGDILNLFDATTEVLTVTDGGKVGIGKTNPASQLEISGGADNPGIALRRNTGGGDVASIAWHAENASPTTVAKINYRGGAAPGGMQFYTGGGTSSELRMLISPAGLVGINTTTAQTELEVFSDTSSDITIHSARTSGTLGGINFANGASAAGIVTAQYFVGTAGHHYWHCNGTERLKLENDGDLTITGVDNAELKLKCGATNGNNIIAFLNSAGATKGRIFYDSDNNFMVFNTDGTSDERMRITNAGAVGIGTNNPQYELHVHPGGATSSGQICAQSEGSNTFAELVLKTTTGGSANIWKNSTGKTDYGGADSLNIYQGANANIAFFTNGNNERLRIKSDGHLKIPDDAKIQIGGVQTTSGDLEIYHTSSGTSWIRHYNTSEYFVIEGNQIDFRDYTNAHYRVRMGPAVELRHNNIERLKTSSTGVTITGEVAASQDYPNYQPALDFNFARVKKLDSRFTYYRSGPASYIDEFGIVQLVGANTPRFDHDPVTKESKGLLIEPSRTNQITYSFDLTGSDWSPINIDRESFTTDLLAPNGKYEATKIILNTTANQHYTNFSGMSKANGAERQCVSFWAKLTSANYPILKSYITGANAFTNYSQQQFNLSTGVVTSGGSGSFTNHSAKMTQYPNGWWKCEYEATLDSSETTKRFQLLGNDGSGNAGNGSDGYYIWGVQVEVGNFATSLIPTYGSPSGGTQPTRGEDIAIIDGTEFTDFFNTVEGTSVVYAHMPVSSGASGLPAYTFKNSSNGNITLGLSRDNNASPAYHYYNDGSNSGFSRASANNQNMYKGAMSFKTSDFDSYVNGSANTNTTTFTMPTIDNLRIGGTGGANQLGGHVARFMYYPVKLTNNQLMTLTS